MRSCQGGYIGSGKVHSIKPKRRGSVGVHGIVHTSARSQYHDATFFIARFPAVYEGVAVRRMYFVNVLAALSGSFLGEYSGSYRSSNTYRTCVNPDRLFQGRSVSPSFSTRYHVT